jgi:hypothetical protein
VIRQGPGDLLEIEYEERWYYLLVLTKIVIFGGNIVFAFHGAGDRQEPDSLREYDPGFNVCTDLLMPKKEGTVTRLRRVEDLSPFWRTRLVKGTNEWRPGHKAEEWFLYDVDDLRHAIDRTRTMPPRYAEAMDDGVTSFDLVAEKILAGYTPDQNPRL